jgi:hypothetical protein
MTFGYYGLVPTTQQERDQERTERALCCDPVVALMGAQQGNYKRDVTCNNEQRSGDAQDSDDSPPADSPTC